MKKQEVPSVPAIKAFRDHVPHGDLVVWYVCAICGHDCSEGKTGWWSYRRGDLPLPLEGEE